MTSNDDRQSPGFTNVKTLGFIMGSLFLIGGILGFVPGVTKDGMYFGMFVVNTPHNILHIASGTIFIIASMLGAGPARLWFLIFGGFYAAISAMGFMVGNGLILGIISNNRCDTWGHAGLAAAMLLVGFVTRKQATACQCNVDACCPTKTGT